jgi:beta-lactamase class A
VSPRWFRPAAPGERAELVRTQEVRAAIAAVPEDMAAATLARIHTGELDGATQLNIEPGRATAPGPTGLTRCRHPARIAIDDLLYLSVAVSYGTASDTLFALTPPDQVTAMLRAWDLRGLTVRT